MESTDKKITIKDIALILNIHHTTVSRALRDHPDIHPDTKKRVFELAKKLNYYPNAFARNLKTNRTNIIGVIVPEIKHYFFANVISGIEEIAHKEGYALLLSQSNENYEREVINTGALVSNNIAGLIVSISQTTKDDSHFRLLQKYGVHLVFADRILESIDASRVTVEDYQGAYNATEYLIKKGYKNIAHVGGSEGLLISRERYNGYREAIKDNNLVFEEKYTIFSGFQEEDGVKGMEYLLKQEIIPDAVLAVNDPVALGIYEVIKKKGLKIPDDIAVIGFSNNPISAIIDPPLTTVEQPAYEIGKQAAIILFDQIKNKTYKSVNKILKTKLIERNSV